MGREIERKFTVRRLPENLSDYPYRIIEQGYLNVAPAIRVRSDGLYTPGAAKVADQHWYMTYKARNTGGSAYDAALSHEEYNLPLDEASYVHLLTKADGHILRKRRYLIPTRAPEGTDATLTIELDIFEAPHEGLQIAEVEFPDETVARAYQPEEWFGEDVTGDPAYSNARLSEQHPA